jgi:hypothetical protein
MTGKHANTDHRLRIRLAPHAPARSRRLACCAGVLTSLLLVGCGPSPNFESAGIGRTGLSGAGEVSIAVPARENASGDLLVAILGAPGNPNTFGPEGWTAVRGFNGFNGAMCQADGQGTACQMTVFYKIADGSESTAAFSWGGSRQAAAAVLRFSNVDANDPIGAANQRRGSSDTVTAPVIETSRDGSRALRIAVVELDEAGPFVREEAAMSDVPPGERVNILSFPTSADDPANGCGPPMAGCETERAVALAVSDTRHRTAGPTGPVSWELPAGDQWLTATIEVKRPPGQ